MKAYRIVLLFIDHDGVGPADARDLIENARLPNHISPGKIMAMSEREIGEWSDDHPLNHEARMADAFEDLFGPECH